MIQFNIEIDEERWLRGYTDQRNRIKRVRKRIAKAFADEIRDWAITFAPKDVGGGTLINSIYSRSTNFGATVGANAKSDSGAYYAMYVEKGTGIYADNGMGRKTPWRYKHKRWGWVVTRGQKPQYFFARAIDKTRLREKRILRGVAGENMGFQVGNIIKSIYAKLSSDSALTTLTPSIFISKAPKSATLPYIVIGNNDLIETPFNVFGKKGKESVVNIYVYDTSRSDMTNIEIAERIDYLLDWKDDLSISGNNHIKTSVQRSNVGYDENNADGTELRYIQLQYMITTDEA